MTDDIDGKALGAFVTGLFDIRERHAAEDQAYDSARRAQTVKVKFPEGIRDVTATFQQEDCFLRPHQDGFNRFNLVPNPMDGWEFRGVIGGEVQWHAFQVPTDAQRRESERLWREEYQLPWPDRCGYNEDFR